MGQGKLTLIRPHNNDCTALVVDAVVAVGVSVRSGVGCVVDVDFGEICRS